MAIRHRSRIHSGASVVTGSNSIALCCDRSALDRNPLNPWVLMANKSTVSPLKELQEILPHPPQHPHSLCFFGTELCFLEAEVGKNGPVPLHSRGLKRFDLCRCSAEVEGQLNRPR